LGNALTSTESCPGHRLHEFPDDIGVTADGRLGLDEPADGALLGLSVRFRLPAANGGGSDAKEVRGFVLGECEKALDAQDAVSVLGRVVRAVAVVNLVEVLAQDGAGFLIGPEQSLVQLGLGEALLQRLL